MFHSRPAAFALRAAPFAISLALVAWAVYLCRDSLGQMPQALRATHLGWSVLGLLSIWAGLAVVSWRLQLVFAAVGIGGGLWRYTLYTLAGLFASNFVPSTGGADLVKAFYIAYDRKASRQICVVASFADRAIGMVIMLLLAALTMRLTLPDSNYTRIATNAALAIVAAAILIGAIESLLPSGSPWRTKTIRLFERFRLHRTAEAAQILLRSPRMLIATAILSVVVCFFFSLGAWCLGRGAAMQAPPLVWIALVNAVFIAMLLPSVGGLGVREVLFILFLKPYAPREQALMLALLYFALFLLTSLLAGAILSFHGWRRFPVFSESESENSPGKTL
ncbi:MAG: lysylphosphatidylglycerol synthase transmembrane domain-containing protein [Candidatus Sumerlaeota bacterium]|nr:lysylphosphatidylglycerol synthase transmembrane domain-containing protein [Candidatus Sumerlaeota bacterium]